jgi:hypothetical protein
MGKLTKFFKNDQALKDEMTTRFYRMGRRKFVLTQGTAPGAITCVLLLAVEYSQHGRYLLEGWWLVGYWAFGLIVGLVLLCGPMTLVALYRWRKIERRVQQLGGPLQWG